MWDLRILNILELVVPINSVRICFIMVFLYCSAKGENVDVKTLGQDEESGDNTVTFE